MGEKCKGLEKYFSFLGRILLPHVYTSVRIYNTRLGGESIELGVNWSSVGTVSAEEAQRFADQLTKAAAIAASSPVNGARIVYAN